MQAIIEVWRAANPIGAQLTAPQIARSAAGPHHRARIGSQGVTLIEAMVVVSVAAIGVAMGLPSYNGFLERQRLSSAMHLLTAHIATARSTAISYRIPTVVCPSNGAGACRKDGNWSQGWLMFFDKDGNRKPDLPQDVLRDENAPIHPTLRIVSSAGRPQLRYQPDGRSGGSNITIRICREDRVLGKVIVNNFGRARTERPAGREAC